MSNYTSFEGDSLLNNIFDILHLAIQDLAPEESSIGSDPNTIFLSNNIDPYAELNPENPEKIENPENPWEDGQKAGSLFDWILSLFETKPWRYYRIPDQTILRFVYQGTYGKWVCLVATPEDTKILVCSVFPTKALESQYSSMMKFIIRANYQLDWGNFDLDLNDGEISFRNSLDVTHIPLQPELVIDLLKNHLKQMDDHWLDLTTYLQMTHEESNVGS